MDEVGTQQNQVTRLTLDLRGSRFTIEQEMLMNLPESVLLCLFPNGLVLSRQPGQGFGDGGEGGEDGMGEGDEDEEEVYMVDVSKERQLEWGIISNYSGFIFVFSLTPLACHMF